MHMLRNRLGLYLIVSFIFSVFFVATDFNAPVANAKLGGDLNVGITKNQTFLVGDVLHVAIYDDCQVVSGYNTCDNNKLSLQKNIAASTGGKSVYEWGYASMPVEASGYCTYWMQATVVGNEVSFVTKSQKNSGGLLDSCGFDITLGSGPYYVTNLVTSGSSCQATSSVNPATDYTGYIESLRCNAVKACMTKLASDAGAEAKCNESWRTCSYEAIASDTATTNGQPDLESEKKLLEGCATQVTSGNLAAVSTSTDEAAAASAKDASCEKNAGSTLGWFVCPIVFMLSTMSDTVAQFIEQMLIVPPLGQSSERAKAIQPIWRIMVVFANLILVVAFLIVIFSQATSIGLTAYGVKKMLPRIIAAAILINLSFFICALAVDITNVIGGSVKGIIQEGNNALLGSSGAMVYSNIITTSLTSLMVGGGTVAIVASTGAIAFVLPVLLVGALALLGIFLAIAFRQALIVIFIILSPLAFAAMILPNTEPLFKKWSQTFMKLLLMYPAIMFIIYGCALFANILLASSDVGR